MTDITELTSVQKNANIHRLSRLIAYAPNDELRQMAVEVEHYTDQLIEALEKAQQQMTESENRVRKQNRHICELFDDNTALRKRIAELESRTVTVKLPNQTQFDDPLSAYEAIEKCKEALTAQGIKWEAE
ncbi:TPA: hypothetical protein ACJIYM_003752 [Klebsiella pneumoniae]